MWVPHDPFMANAWTMQTAIAEATKRVVVGSLGTSPYTTDPSEIATHLATLDLLSGGRAALGLGLHTTSMVEWLGLDATDVVERTRAAVAIVRALLRGETVTHEGPYEWGEECALRFAPLRADPPIHVAGFGAELLRLAGEIGDGAMPMATPPESVADHVAEVRAGALSAGRDPAGLEIVACAWLSLSEDGRGTEDPLRPMIATFAPYLEERALASIGLSRAGLAPLRALVDSGRLDEAAAAVTPPMFALALAGRSRAGVRADHSPRRARRDAHQSRRSARPRSAPRDQPARRARPPRPPELRTNDPGTPCGDPRSRSAPTPCPRARCARSRARIRDRRWRARRSRSARR